MPSPQKKVKHESIPLDNFMPLVYCLPNGHIDYAGIDHPEYESMADYGFCALIGM